MKRSRVPLPTPALIVAVLALFVALSGAAVGLPGKKSVDKNDIKRNAVTAKTIKRNAVTNAKIAGNAVTGGKIANGAVDTGNLANNGVTTGKIANAAVTTGKIANFAVTTNKIGDGSVDSAKIVDGSIGIADLNASTHLLCGPGGQYLQGVCIATALRPNQNYQDARNDCGVVGARLPTLAELESFKLRGGTIGAGEYTLDLTGPAPPGGSTYTYDNAFTIGLETNQATSRPFRCVFEPTG